MKKEKILISINDLNDVEKYKKIGINNFLFAIKDFSIGYNLFDINEIKKLNCNIYLYLNRVLNCNDVDSLKKCKENFNFVKGIIFEDIAVFQIFNNTNISLYFNQSHFSTNYSSINYWNNLVDSVVISNELTFDEVNFILNNENKPLILNIFGKNNIMYSRRSLLTNFNNYFSLDNNKKIILKESHTNNEFLSIEDNNGTMLFNNIPFNLIDYIKDLDDKKILFYYINTFGFKYEDIIKVLDNTFSDSNDGFMKKKTIYKLGDTND